MSDIKINMTGLDKIKELAKKAKKASQKKYKIDLKGDEGYQETEEEKAEITEAVRQLLGEELEIDLVVTSPMN